MTAPRTARPYRPAWHEPRHGVRASFQCAAVAVLLGCALYACATRASGQGVDFPASVPLRAVSGAVVCHAAPMADGALTARHCIQINGRLTVDAIAARYSLDALRDLAHFAAHAVPSVRERPAVIGETLRWRNERAAGAVRVETATDDAGEFEFTRVYGNAADHGESGTGLHGDDGALVGVLVTLWFNDSGQTTGRGTAVQVP